MFIYIFLYIYIYHTHIYIYIIYMTGDEILVQAVAGNYCLRRPCATLRVLREACAQLTRVSARRCFCATLARPLRTAYAILAPNPLIPNENHVN